MSDKLDVSTVPPPESNAQVIASRLVYQTVDLDGSGLVSTLQLLLSRAEHLKALNVRLIELDAKVAKKQVTTQEEYNAEVLDGLYETTCIKWFLASTLKELARRLEGEVQGAQIRCCPITRITYNEDGEVESFKLDSGDTRPGKAQ